MCNQNSKKKVIEAEKEPEHGKGKKAGENFERQERHRNERMTNNDKQRTRKWIPVKSQLAGGPKMAQHSSSYAEKKFFGYKQVCTFKKKRYSPIKEVAKSLPNPVLVGIYLDLWGTWNKKIDC